MVALREFGRPQGPVTLLDVKTQDPAGTAEPIVGVYVLVDPRSIWPQRKNDVQHELQPSSYYAALCPMTFGTLLDPDMTLECPGPVMERTWVPYWNALSVVEADERWTPTETELVRMPRSPLVTIGNRPVAERTRELIVQGHMERLVEKMAELVDALVAPQTRCGGSIDYVRSFENSLDWEIVVVTKLAVSSAERFDLSTRIGNALNELLTTECSDPNWMRVTFRLELA